MSVTLTNPFTRLCSQVAVSVKAASVSPVTVKGLRVNFITMKNLSDSRTYRLGIMHGIRMELRMKTTGGF